MSELKTMFQLNEIINIYDYKEQLIGEDVEILSIDDLSEVSYKVGMKAKIVDVDINDEEEEERHNFFGLVLDFNVFFEHNQKLMVKEHYDFRVGDYKNAPLITWFESTSWNRGIQRIYGDFFSSQRNADNCFYILN